MPHRLAQACLLPAAAGQGQQGTPGTGEGGGQGMGVSSSICLSSQTWKSEGFFALYKGFWPNWLRLGPWNIIVSSLCCWAVVERDKGRTLLGRAGQG